jgi:hypothetical protein
VRSAGRIFVPEFQRVRLHLAFIVMVDDDNIDAPYLALPAAVSGRIPAPWQSPVALSVWQKPAPFRIADLPASAESAELRSLFKKEPPTSPDQDIFVLGLPERRLVQRLGWEVHVALAAGAQSLSGFSAGARLPLWIITAWDRCHEAADAQAAWGRAHEIFLREIHSKRASLSKDLASVVAAGEALFMTVGWKVSSLIRGPSSCAYWQKASLGPNLTSLDLPQLFERGFIDSRFTDTAIAIVNDALHHTDVFVGNSDIQWALEQDEAWEDFDTSDELKHLRFITAKIIAEKKNRIRLGWNSRSVHWTMFELTLSTNTIAYGDGFTENGARPSAVDLKRLRRWMRIMVPTQASDDARIGAPADFARQQDGYSCGIIMLDGILRNTGVNVPLWTEATKDIRRIEWALRLCVHYGSYAESSFGLQDGALQLAQAAISHQAQDEGEHTDGGQASPFGPPSPSGPSSPSGPPSPLEPPQSSSPVPMRSPSPQSPSSSPPPLSVPQEHASTIEQPVQPAVEQSPRPKTIPKRTKVDLRISESMKTPGTIAALFRTITKEEAEAQRRLEAERDHLKVIERRERLESEALKSALLKVEREKALARERQRRHREKVKAEAEEKERPVRHNLSLSRTYSISSC